MPETLAQKLVKELQELDIPKIVTRRSGWLKRYYLGENRGYNPATSCPQLTIFLSDTYHQGKLKHLSAKEWLQLLEDAENLYPKYRA